MCKEFEKLFPNGILTMVVEEPPESDMIDPNIPFTW
jgi:hypothetical protein